MSLIMATSLPPLRCLRFVASASLAPLRWLRFVGSTLLAPLRWLHFVGSASLARDRVALSRFRIKIEKRGLG